MYYYQNDPRNRKFRGKDSTRSVFVTLLSAILVILALGAALIAAIHVSYEFIYSDFNQNREFDLYLRDYERFFEICEERGYDRDECALIWSGRD